MHFQTVRRALISFAFISAVTLGCGGGDAEPAVTTSEVLTSTDSESLEVNQSTSTTIATQDSDIEESATPNGDLLVALIAEELMSDPEIPVELSLETATCIGEWALNTMDIEDLDDLETLDSTEDEMWLGGLTECVDSSTMIEFIVADMGATEEQTQCLIDSLGNETEGLTALFEMQGEPESEEQMMFLFTFMAAAIECGVDLTEEIESGLDDGEYGSPEGLEPITDPMCPNGEPCICIDVDGSCDDGDDDWGWIDNGNETYFCSNDGREYAQNMGGMLCANTMENA
jgi:hypothetical protein